MKAGLIFGIFSYLEITSLVLPQTAKAGVIRGTVQDRADATLIDVRVTLRDVDRNQSWGVNHDALCLFQARVQD